MDLDPGSGVRDYRGGSRAYNGHRGTDLDVPDFRWMDRGFPVLAAAGGQVSRVHDGEFDRNTACGFLEVLSPANRVEVTHPDGSRAVYAHLARGSVRVAVGDLVVTGQPLGTVGSSGCSTAPHLHFEVRDAEGAVVDPFLASRWEDPPPYDLPLTLMSFFLKEGAIGSVDEIKDPPPNAAAIPEDAVLGIGLSLAGGSPEDTVGIRLEGGRNPSARSVRLGESPPHSYRSWNLPPEEHRSARRVVIELNGEPAAARRLR